MRTVAVAIAVLLAAAGCAATPYDRLPDSALVQVDGGLAIEDWPAVARRPYDGDAAGGMPPRFHDRAVLRGLVGPTAFAFAPDGRIFVAEQRGTVKVFRSLDDPAPLTVLDFRRQVYAFSEMGLLGLALDPDFEREPYLYLAYTHDAPLGGVAPAYGSDDFEMEICLEDPAPDCIVSGRISRVLLAGDGAAGPEQVLLEEWCHDGGHSLGTVVFDASGALYAGAGDTAGPEVVEYGQATRPPNPCGDPPAAPGVAPVPPNAEGGALRSQDLRTRDDPLGLAGTIIRIDRATGAALPDNPLAADAEENARRLVAYGLRNPFRFTFRPDTSELWIADVGWDAYEELNLIADPLAGPVPNLGWPCYEGPYRQPGYEAAGLDVCTQLYADERDLLRPVLSLARPASDEQSCAGSGSALSGIAFYDGAAFPAEYAGALFFGDSSRGCIWVVRAGGDGRPDFNTIRQFRVGTRPSDMQVGPDGALYVLDYASGRLQRIGYYPGRQPPRARLRGSASRGPAPLTVTLDASRSSDADGDVLTFAWDTDADGEFDDGTGPRLPITLAEPGSYPVSVRVTDAGGEWAEATYTLRVESPP